MKILILGGSGMFGNGLVTYLAPNFEVAFTVRSTNPSLDSMTKCYEYIDGYDLSSIIRTIYDFKPHVVINAIGVVKQKKEISISTTIYLNSQLPHELSKICELANSKLIILSTDCVFSGNKGNYFETDVPDAWDYYGRSKILGEIYDQNHVITIRSSTIGLEMKSTKGLLEWFLSQNGEIFGYKNAIYSGFTTNEFANVLKTVFENRNKLSGLYHISSNPISKLELLTRLKEKLNMDNILIKEDKDFNCNRSLNSEKFKSITGYNPPSWDEMLTNLALEIQTRNKK